MQSPDTRPTNEASALRRTDERHRAMIANISDVIAIISADAVIRYKSPNIERWFGWRPEDLVGQDAWITVHPDDLERIQREFQRLLSGESDTSTVTYRYRCKDGSHRWIELTAVNRCDEPHIGGVLANYRDITDRRRAEEELRDREEQFRLAIEGTRDGLWDWDLRRNETFHSNRFATMLGYEPEELSGGGAAWTSLLHPDDERSVLDAAAAYLSRASDTYEPIFRMRAKDGTYRWVIARGKALFEDGVPVRFLGFNTDITELKRTEEALRAEQRRWSLAQRVARFGSWEFDPASGRIWGSVEAFDVFGIPLDRETNPDQLLPLERVEACIVERERAHQALMALVLRDVPYEQEYTVIRETDGEAIRIYSRAEKFQPAPGAPEKVIGTIQDVTERARAVEERGRLEAQLHQAQKMETVGRLAGGVAHDFNNMLGAILGNVELAQLELGPDSPIAVELAEIEAAALRSAQLTRQLLGFARKQPVEPRVLDLDDVIGGMYRMLLRLLGENIELVWSPKHTLWPVEIDPGQVDQLLTNLLVNARDAIDGIGRIEIETRNVVVDEAAARRNPDARPGEFAVFSVRDDGCGIDDGVRARLFEPFFTTKPRGEGTGLGLATVYGIVKQNGGFIDVSSERGEGSVFTVHLPRTERSFGEAEDGATAALRGGSETVLLVEDETAVLQLGRRMLERLGYTVLTASRPAAALALAREHGGDIRLLVTDVLMPEMNGRDLAARLRAMLPGLPVIYVSGYAEDVIAHDGVLEPGTELLAKPFTMRTLAEGVRHALDNPPS